MPNFSFLGFTGKILNKLMAIGLKFLFDLYVPRHLKKTSKNYASGVTKTKRATRHIVSLTSFPARIHDIWICLETILRQSVKPDEIILWLANEQFPNKELPESLTQLQRRGLVIKYCDDLRSHKKYYYAMQEFPSDNIITLDDDVYYPNNFLEKLIAIHQKFPKVVAANRVHKITFREGKILAYRKWKHNYNKLLEPSNLLVQTGIAGVLYPPNSLDKIVFDKELIKELCLNADDLWLKFTGFINGTKVVTDKNFNKDMITIVKTHEHSLIKVNGPQGGNDLQLKRLIEYFKIKPADLLK